MDRGQIFLLSVVEAINFPHLFPLNWSLGKISELDISYNDVLMNVKLFSSVVSQKFSLLELGHRLFQYNTINT